VRRSSFPFSTSLLGRGADIILRSWTGEDSNPSLRLRKWQDSIEVWAWTCAAKTGEAGSFISAALFLKYVSSLWAQLTAANWFPVIISTLVLFTIALYYVYRTAILTARGDRHLRPTSTTVLLLGSRPMRLAPLVEPVLVVAGSVLVAYLTIYLWSAGFFVGYQLIIAGMGVMILGLVLVVIAKLRRRARTRK
jgi:hypothetical protein